MVDFSRKSWSLVCGPIDGRGRHRCSVLSSSCVLSWLIVRWVGRSSWLFFVYSVRSVNFRRLFPEKSSDFDVWFDFQNMVWGLGSPRITTKDPQVVFFVVILGGPLSYVP